MEISLLLIKPVLLHYCDHYSNQGPSHPRGPQSTQELSSIHSRKRSVKCGWCAFEQLNKNKKSRFSRCASLIPKFSPRDLNGSEQLCLSSPPKSLICLLTVASPHGWNVISSELMYLYYPWATKDSGASLASTGVLQ